MSETPLAKKLKLIIEANGPLSVAEYMAHCLGDPAHGYYMTRDPFGAAGDFVTAPEVSQMFGEIVGAWLIQAWSLSGRPSPVRLVELGPGRGTLMRDILRVARRVPDFWAALSVHLVETSPALKARQAETLAATGIGIAWHGAFGEVPDGPLLLVANEFFDALPIRQFVHIDGAWCERVVGLYESGALGFGLHRLPVPPPSRATGKGDLAEHGGGGGRRDGVPAVRYSAALAEWDGEDAVPPRIRNSPPPPPSSGRARGPVPLPRSAGEEHGAVHEICPAATALVAQIAGRLARHSGAALLIDYGYEGPAYGDTLQAVRGHKFADPLTTPGEADLTAHVDFAALARAASEAGAEVAGPIAQRDFLLALGLRERAARLGEHAEKSVRASLHAALKRLTDADQMGTLFKVLAITTPGIHLPPFEVR